MTIVHINLCEWKFQPSQLFDFIFYKVHQFNFQKFSRNWLSNDAYQIQYIACNRCGLSEAVHLLYAADLESCYPLLLLLVASDLLQRCMGPQNMRILWKGCVFAFTLSPFATALRELLRIKTSWPDRILSNVIGQVLWVHWLIGNIGVAKGTVWFDVKMEIYDGPWLRGMSIRETMLAFPPLLFVVLKNLTKHFLLVHGGIW